ncbi:MAG: TonB-dependent receptor [Bacteroidales bacterium]
MKKSLLLVIFLVFIVINAFTQKVTVISSDDKNPVPNVSITNETGRKLVITGISGTADLSIFGTEEEICFRHFSFTRVCTTPSAIIASGNIVELELKVFDIQEFIVSANKWEQNREEVPERVTTISRDEQEFRNPQTAADLIAGTGSIFVQKSQLGGGSPMIRGFATNRVLIVVDGVRMNNAIYREGNIQNIISLDANSMASTEIIYGPGAFIYGSDAIGGVMDFHTIEPNLPVADSCTFRLNALTRYSSADNEKTGHLDISFGKGKISALAGITISDFGDLRMGGGNRYASYLREEYVTRINGRDSIVTNKNPRVQVGSAYSQINTTGKIRYRISEKTELSFSNHYSALSSVPRYDRLTQYKSGVLRYGDWYYGPQLWMMNNLTMKVTPGNWYADEIRIIAAHQDYRESRHDRSVYKNNINEQFEKVGIFSFNADVQKKLGDGDRNLFYGIEAVTNDIVSTARTRDIITGIVQVAGPRYPDGSNRYRSFAAYTGLKDNLSRKLTLSGGLRFSHVILNSLIKVNYYNFPFDKISISNGALTGSAGLAYRPDSKTIARLNISTGFRAPNLDDAGKVFESAPGIVVVPNPGLEPEYATTIDFGLSRDFGDKLHLEVTSFFTWLANAMVRHDFLFNGNDSIDYMGELSKVEAIVNGGFARVYGLSSSLQFNLTGNCR